MALSSADKIRSLLKKGLAVSAIAKRLKVSTGYVYTVRWNQSNKGAKKHGKVNGSGAEAVIPATVETPVVSLRGIINDTVKEVVRAEVTRLLQS